MRRPCFVYWLYLPGDSDPARQGYIGKAFCTATRWKAHHKSSSFPANFLKAILFEGTEEECLAKERELRPLPGMGWNRIAGGGQPPSQKGKRHGPRRFTDEHRRNLSAAHLGQRAWNKGLSMPSMLGEVNPAKRPEARTKISLAKLTQPSCKPVQIAGVTYQSERAAARALGVPRTTLRRQLHREAA